MRGEEEDIEFGVVVKGEMADDFAAAYERIRRESQHMQSGNQGIGKPVTHHAP